MTTFIATLSWLSLAVLMGLLRVIEPYGAAVGLYALLLAIPAALVIAAFARGGK